MCEGGMKACLSLGGALAGWKVRMTGPRMAWQRKTSLFQKRLRTNNPGDVAMSGAYINDIRPFSRRTAARSSKADLLIMQTCWPHYRGELTSEHRATSIVPNNSSNTDP